MEMIVCNICLFIFVVAIIIIAIYGAIVCCIMLIGHKNLHESIRILNNALHYVYKSFASCTSQVQYQTYNVFIGDNGYIIRDDIVNEYFAPLQKYWETVFYSHINNPSPNVVEYVFRAYFPTRYDSSNRILNTRVKQIAEQALTKHFHSLGITIPADRFVAVKIRSDMVSVYFAINDNGFGEIESLRQCI